jgi:PTH2 family peptidyl-tRNA hydrolase
VSGVKQVIVLRKDLGMRKGKMCAQAAHASMKVFFDRMVEVGDGCYELGPAEGWDWSVVREWVDGIFTKVVVGCDSEKALLDLVEKAKTAGLPHALITDAGKTEFHGQPTHTAVTIGPARSEDLDPITGNLPLL